MPDEIDPARLLAGDAAVKRMMQLRRNKPFFDRYSPAERLPSVLAASIRIMQQTKYWPTIHSQTITDGDDLLAGHEPPAQRGIEHRQHVLERIQERAVHQGSCRTGHTYLADTYIVTQCPFVGDPVSQLAHLTPGIRPVLCCSITARPVQTDHMAVLPYIGSAHRDAPQPVVRPT